MGQKPSKEQKTLRESYKDLFWCLVTRGQDLRGTLLFSTILIVGRSQNIERGVETTLRGVKLLVFRATKVHFYTTVYSSIQNKYWEQKH